MEIETRMWTWTATRLAWWNSVRTRMVTMTVPAMAKGVVASGRSQLSRGEVVS